MISTKILQPIGKTVAATVLSASLVLTTVTPTVHVAYAVSTQQIKLQEQTTIAHGAQHKVYTKLINNQTVKIDVIEVDLANPNIKVAPVYGSAIGTRETVTSMTNKAGAVAALNASFFNMQNEGGTFGTIVQDGEIISNPDKQVGWNSFAILRDNTAIIQELGFTGQVHSPYGVSFDLEGINKTEYWPNNSPASNYSGTIHMFTPAWGESSRGQLPGYKGIVEVEVTEGAVTDIRIDQPGKKIPQNGYVLMGHGKGAEFLQDYFQVGDPAQVTYQLTPNADVEQAIGANYLLVNQGQRVSTSHVENNLKGRNSRSALGVSQNGKKLYMVSIDKVNSNPGVTLDELADLLIELGSYRAVNLDGGGSTSMVVRNPGQLTGTRVNETTWERSVADALAIFNIAPKGAPVNINIQGSSLVLQNDTVSFTVSGYDSNYHPITNADVTYKTSDAAAEINNNQITFTKAGRQLVQVSYHGKSADHAVRVVGAEDIQELKVSPTDIIVFPGSTQEIKATLLLKDGNTIALKPEQIQWSTTQTGNMQGLTFTAGQQKSTGKLEANVLGFSGSLAIEVGYTFKDIKGHWAQATIEKMAELGHAKGTGVSLFGPNDNVKRGDFIVFLSRVLDWNITEREKNVQLTESVPEYAKESIKYALHHGIIKGDQYGLVNADKPITRMEMATILERIISAQTQPPAQTVNTPMDSLFADWAGVPEWARDSIQYVSEREIFGGMNGKFYPRNSTTRAEVMAVLMRAFVK